MASMNRGMNHLYKVLHSQYTGYHSNVVENVLKKSIIDRKSQFLTHLATGLKAWFSAVSTGSEVEIQIAIYDESCIIIGSNKNDTAEFMYKEFVKKQANDFLKQLGGVASTAANHATKSKALEAARIERHSLKLGQELGGKRDVGLPLLKELEQEAKDICVRFDASDDIGASFASFLNRSGKMATKHVAFVTSSKMEAHAEQKILTAMCKAASHLQDRTKSIVIAGTFRPCRGCFEALSVVQKYCFSNIQFGVRPGHFWRTTTKAHMGIRKMLVDDGFISQSQLASDFDEDGLLVGLTSTSYRPVLRTYEEDSEDALHYATDSDSEFEDD